jgi:predicted ribosomally synthesized peptide with nif11-like leader
MSRENVVRFIEEASRDEAMNRKVAEVEPKGSAWAGVASAAGFEFTADELREVSEVLLDRKLEGDDFVEALLAAKEGELHGDDLQAVVGGVTSPTLVRFDYQFMQGLTAIGGDEPWDRKLRKLKRG